MFINRFEEAMWLILKSLCYLQSRVHPFSERWHELWHVLDDSLRIVHEQAVSDGRGVAAEFMQMVAAKFDFSPERTFYYEGAI